MPDETVQLPTGYKIVPAEHGGYHLRRMRHGQPTTIRIRSGGPPRRFKTEAQAIEHAQRLERGDIL